MFDHVESYRLLTSGEPARILEVEVSDCCSPAFMCNALVVRLVFRRAGEREIHLAVLHRSAPSRGPVAFFQDALFHGVGLGCPSGWKACHEDQKAQECVERSGEIMARGVKKPPSRELLDMCATLGITYKSEDSRDIQEIRENLKALPGDSYQRYGFSEIRVLEGDTHGKGHAGLEQYPETL